MHLAREASTGEFLLTGMGELHVRHHREQASSGCSAWRWT